MRLRRLKNLAHRPMAFLSYWYFKVTVGSISELRPNCQLPASKTTLEPAQVAQALLPVRNRSAQAGVPVPLALAHGLPSCSAGIRIRAMAPASLPHLLVSTANWRRPLAVSR